LSGQIENKPYSVAAFGTRAIHAARPMEVCSIAANVAVDWLLWRKRRPLTYFSIDPQCVFLMTMWESGDRKEPTDHARIEPQIAVPGDDYSIG
jgi:hypothetical protein